MHDWSDSEVDWVGINDAAYFIASFCKRWARLGGDWKEKYGTVRFYAMFGHISLHSITHPGYVYRQYPKWLWKLDIYYISPILNKLFGNIFFKWQKLIYSIAYIKAIHKWPHLRAEILCAADWPEYINGVTKTEYIINEKGEKEEHMHILGWNGETLSTRIGIV